MISLIPHHTASVCKLSSLFNSDLLKAIHSQGNCSSDHWIQLKLSNAMCTTCFSVEFAALTEWNAREHPKQNSSRLLRSFVKNILMSAWNVNTFICCNMAYHWDSNENTSQILMKPGETTLVASCNLKKLFPAKWCSFCGRNVSVWVWTNFNSSAFLPRIKYFV